MHVAVAIVGFRNCDDIVRCLDALAASTHSDFEVVICENGGADAHARLTAALPAALPGGQAVRAVLAPGNLGYGGGVNLCFSQTPGADAWWVLNPDTYPAPDAMAVMLERLTAGNCEMVGCPLYLDNGAVQFYGGLWRGWTAWSISLGYGSPQDAPVDPAVIEGTQNYLNGASILIGRRFLETVGPMREDYFLYCEDVEWCLRGLALGMRIGFAPGTSVLHYQGTTTGSGGRVATRSRVAVYLTERNKILLTRDQFPWRLPVAAGAALALITARFLRRGGWRQLSYGLSGWLAGLLDRRGPPQWMDVTSSAGAAIGGVPTPS